MPNAFIMLTRYSKKDTVQCVLVHVLLCRSVYLRLQCVSISVFILYHPLSRLTLPLPPTASPSLSLSLSHTRARTHTHPHPHLLLPLHLFNLYLHIPANVFYSLAPSTLPLICSSSLFNLLSPSCFHHPLLTVLPLPGISQLTTTSIRRSRSPSLFPICAAPPNLPFAPVRLLAHFPQSPRLTPHLSWLTSSQGRRISKSVSMNSGACVGLKALSHSDSYTWAVENRRSSATRYFRRDGSQSSLDSVDLHCTDFYPEDSMPAESQVTSERRRVLTVTVTVT